MFSVAKEEVIKGKNKNLFYRKPKIIFNIIYPESLWNISIPRRCRNYIKKVNTEVMFKKWSRCTLSTNQRDDTAGEGWVGSSTTHLPTPIHAAQNPFWFQGSTFRTYRLAPATRFVNVPLASSIPSCPLQMQPGEQCRPLGGVPSDHTVGVRVH